MEDNPRFKWWFDQAAEVFKQQRVSELYGPYLFRKHKIERPNPYYSSPLDERGEAVWLVQSDHDEPCTVRRVSEDEKRSRIGMPKICAFMQVVTVPMQLWGAAGTGVEQVEVKVLEAASSLANTVNHAVVDVLLAAAQRRVAVQNGRLDHLLAEAADSLADAGFSSDRLVFPRNLQHRMLSSGIVIADVEIQSSHYIGQTGTGLRAFWSSKLPDSTALILDSTSGIGLTWDIRHVQPESVGWPTQLTVIYCFNPIVQNTGSLVALYGIDEAEEFVPSTATVHRGIGVRMAPAQASDRLNPELQRLNVRKGVRDIIRLLLDDAERSYQAEAYLASNLLYRAVIEAILLGLLLKRRKKAEDLSGKCVPKDKNGQPKRVEDWRLEEMIKRAVAMGLLDDTDESSMRTLQNYGNLVHPARILRKRPFVSPAEDAKIVRSHIVKLLKRYGAMR